MALDRVTVLMFCVYTSCICAFNVRRDNLVRFQLPNRNLLNQERSAYFGYSLVFVEDDKKIWLVVGAPRQNASQYNEQGGLFACDVEECRGRNCNKCSPIGVPRHDAIDYGRYTELGDQSWLGQVTVSKGGKDLLTCAPRWTNEEDRDTRDMNGACYWDRVEALSKGGRLRGPMPEILPLLDQSKQRSIDNRGNTNYMYQLGQAGFAATYMPNSGKLVLGSPGLLNWAGGIVVGEVEGESDIFRPILATKVLLNPGRELSFYDLLGYSVAGIKLSSTEEYVAIGAYRASYTGRVLIARPSEGNYDGVLSRAIQRLEPTQGGHLTYFSGYGSCMTAVDTDGDGRDELLVGAPLADNDGGEVYVYKWKQEQKFQLERKLQQSDKHGRFGSAIANLGDIDADGYNDVAVGAPMQGSGVVFIYMGGKEGLSTSPGQIISASDLGFALTGFGASFSPGKDVNGDGYNDVAIGAYASDTVLLLKARPVADITMTTTVNPKILVSDGMTFSVTVCVEYAGRAVPRSVVSQISVRLDQDFLPMDARAEFSESGSSQIVKEHTLLSGADRCLQLTAALQKNVVNVLDPLRIKVSLSSDQIEGMGSSKCPDCPVLRSGGWPQNLEDVAVAVGCGKDLKCNAKLSIRTHGSEEPVIIDTTRTFAFSVTVSVDGDYAYSPKLKVVLPGGFRFAEFPANCQITTERLTAICVIQNPLKKLEKTEFQLQIPRELRLSTKQVTIDLEATAVNAREISQAVITFGRNVQLQIEGNSDPLPLLYKPTSPKEELPLTYNIHVSNQGKTPANDVILHAVLPHTSGRSNYSMVDTTTDDAFGNDGISCKALVMPGTVSIVSIDKPSNFEAQKRISCTPENLFTKSTSPSSSNGYCLVYECQLPNDLIGTRRVKIEATLLKEVYDDTDRSQTLFQKSTVIDMEMNVRVEWQQQTASAAVGSVLAPEGWRLPPAPVPWWVYLAAAGGGLVILVGVILVLYKCGFFKRKRPNLNKEDGNDEEMEQFKREMLQD